MKLTYRRKVLKKDYTTSSSDISSVKTHLTIREVKSRKREYQVAITETPILGHS